ncbi:transketolase [Candidatus Curtissbacteria bacterium]|nr:transketolase [Candidatus Curtissbacteria bacterium]
MKDIGELEELSKLVRYYILRMTTEAGSGHPTSSLSATDIAVALFFSKLRFDLKNPDNPANDRVIFSKGHVSPLIYALYAVAGVLTEKDLLTYRKFKSPLEGHPTPRFKYAEVATGSLGQGLSIGLGMALAIRQECQMSNVKCQMWPMVYVLMGDSEMAEGSVWEAIELASYYKLSNLVGIIDVNRLGQAGETMLGWDVEAYKRRIASFGWEGHVVDGHDLKALTGEFDQLPIKGSKPQMIIAKTIKGKGISFLENKEGWHGKALPQEDFKKAVLELGDVDRKLKGEIKKPKGSLSLGKGKEARNDMGVGVGVAARMVSHSTLNENETGSDQPKRQPKPNGHPDLNLTTKTIATPRIKLNYKLGEMVATRKAYGEALSKIGEVNPNVVVLDAEVKNSTFAQIFAERFRERFFEMFIAEQNMVGAALGLSKRGKIPFVSTFAAFLTRAFDQIRMSAISGGNIKFAGSHCGVSIGEDGPSQMGLEDIAMFRSIFGSVIFCPGDAVACEKLVVLAAATNGLFYIRTNRPATPVIYGNSEKFVIGGCKVIRSSRKDVLTVVSSGVTLIEAIRAGDKLAKVGVNVRVIDAYSIKPIDEMTLKKAANETNNLIVTVEDHYFDGGLGDAVLNVFARDGRINVHKLAVNKLPMSGKGEELLGYEGISASAIIKKVREIVKFSGKNVS